MRTIAPRAVGIEEIGSTERRMEAGPRVCITFDDGFTSLLRHAIPALMAHVVRATVFIVTGRLGRRPDWYISQDEPEYGQRLMSSTEIRALPEQVISIGSHTVSHRMLNALPPREVMAELRDSKHALEDLLGKRIQALSFPHGEYDERCVQLAYEAGYGQLFTIETCSHPGPLPHGLIGRIGVSPDDWRREFTMKAAGAYDWSYHVRRTKRRLLETIERTRRSR